ncbi:PAS domain-containing protein [Coraliomargarita parva]|uniref:PAS domain-containing protein n=1 Tax=Coraliomargarita parva TaxID=3014050 RepID=UPI0022B5B7E1|nr:hypothetical protein [Coraliomargarita parva]
MRLYTEFASAERSSWEELYQQITSIKSCSSLVDLYDQLDENLMLLNQHRQIVYLNPTCLRMLGLDDPAKAYGCRPGEVMHCCHATEDSNGCGTSWHCRFCQALRAYMASQSGRVAVKNCHIQLEYSNQTIHCRIGCITMRVNGQPYTLLQIEPIDTSSSSKQDERLQDLRRR